MEPDADDGDGRRQAAMKMEDVAVVGLDNTLKD